MKRSKTVKNQTVSAILMALMGTAVYAGAQSYISSYDIPENKPARPAVSKPPVVPEETKTVETALETEMEEVFTPSLSALNLAYSYPEGADRTDAANSMAGQIIRELSVKDSEWLASIYGLSNRKPEEAAAKLGLSPDSVRGLYNPLDGKQKEDDPDSWLISEWSQIDMVFTDENGNRIMADSNIKEIMALANTYFYYSDPEDSGAFLDYALSLWDLSHSTHYSIGEVYYCDGCLDEAIGKTDAVETVEPAQEAAESAPDGTAQSAESAEAGPGVSPAPEKTADTPDSGDAAKASDNGSDAAHTENTVAMENTAAMENAGATEREAVTGAAAVIGAAVVTGAAAVTENTAAAANTSAAAIEGASAAENAAAESAATGNSLNMSAEETAPSGNEAGTTGQQEPTEEIGPGIVLMQTSMAAETEQAEEETKAQVKCPGHVDLHITAMISGSSSSAKSLFSLADNLGKGEDSSGFTGWNEENRNAAVNLAAQDWRTDYGLSVSSTYITNPLSSSEIAYYLSLLPSGTSEERRKLIRYALSSVGKVPYYWGGKPSAPDYDGNYFGSLITADEKGRTMKGLDCSGWINWVYWSSIGKRLPAESTEGLSNCGSAVAREDLKPGDIIVRLGEEGHVVMFLAWESGGRMKVLHESSGSVNNVTVSTMQASWPYYRKLID